MENFMALEEISKPDPRMELFVLVDRKTGKKVRDRGLEDHYESVAKFNLSCDVPDNVVSQFNVSKNVLLYAYYSYYFHSVATQHVLSTLEFALRARIGDKELKKIKSKGLFKYLDYVVEQGWIKNEDFSSYHKAPYMRARQEYEFQKHLEMKEKGLSEILLNYGEIDLPSENTCDHLTTLKENLNKIRNEFAHGSTDLTPSFTYQIFRTTMELINALFDENHKPEVGDLKLLLKGKSILRTVATSKV